MARIFRGMSLETILERPEIVDNVSVGSTETFVSDEGFEIGVICEVSVETVFIARVASTKSLDAKVEDMKMSGVLKGINLRLCKDT